MKHETEMFLFICVMFDTVSRWGCCKVGGQGSAKGGRPASPYLLTYFLLADKAEGERWGFGIVCS